MNSNINNNINIINTNIDHASPNKTQPQRKKTINRHLPTSYNEAMNDQELLMNQGKEGEHETG